MSVVQPFLAQNILPTEVLPETWHWMGLTLKEMLMLFGALGLVTVLLVLWAVYIRKAPRQHSHRHHHHHPPLPPEQVNNSSNAEPDADSEANDEKKYRRKRRRRREHRPRNPTLAETGGLPPIRSERPSDPLP